MKNLVSLSTTTSSKGRAKLSEQLRERILNLIFKEDRGNEEELGVGNEEAKDGGDETYRMRPVLKSYAKQQYL